MSLAADFLEIVDSLPDDWTDLEVDLRIADETRYVDAAVFLVVANAQPYSTHDWHWRLLVAHRFGHAAAVEAVHMALGLLDDHLAGREFFAGGRYSVADIALYAYTHVAHEGGFDLGRYPGVSRWLARIAATPRHVPLEWRP